MTERPTFLEDTFPEPCSECSKVCGCDGAYDDGCHSCTPDMHKCPKCGAGGQPSSFAKDNSDA